MVDRGYVSRVGGERQMGVRDRVCGAFFSSPFVANGGTNNGVQMK